MRLVLFLCLFVSNAQAEGWKIWGKAAWGQWVFPPPWQDMVREHTAGPNTMQSHLPPSMAAVSSYLNCQTLNVDTVWHKDKSLMKFMGGAIVWCYHYCRGSLHWKPLEEGGSHSIIAKKEAATMFGSSSQSLTKVTLATTLRLLKCAVGYNSKICRQRY